MSEAIRVGLIGDHDPEVLAHRAIPRALELSAAELGTSVRVTWLPTESLDREDVASELSSFSCLWAVPSTPYASGSGALAALRYAREEEVPFLGTCGGLQYAVVEFARHAAGLTGATHAEEPDADGPRVIDRLACELIEVSEEIALLQGTVLAGVYGAATIRESYRCRFGINERYVSVLEHAGMRVSALGPDGEVRGVELLHHPFYLGVLFQPERRALQQQAPELVTALLAAAQAHRAGRPPAGRAATD